MNIIFLDIDGVLNYLKPGSPHGSTFGYARHILPEKVDILNEILDKTGAKVVLSSSWRHLVHQGHMTIYGMQGLFRSHNINATLLGITPGETGDDEPRCRQILAWLTSHPDPERRFCVLDDDPQAFGLTEAGALFLPGILTDPMQGLLPHHVQEVATLLS